MTVRLLHTSGPRTEVSDVTIVFVPSSRASSHSIFRWNGHHQVQGRIYFTSVDRRLVPRTNRRIVLPLMQQHSHRRSSGPKAVPSLGPNVAKRYIATSSHLLSRLVP
jgi:hypothetical protein